MSDTLLAVSFGDAETGLAVGPGGVVLRTTDGGTTWVSQDPLVGCCFDVLFIDANTVAAVGVNTIFRSTDGGVTWLEQEKPTFSGLLSVSFADADNGAAAGGNGTIIWTTDGGDG